MSGVLCRKIGVHKVFMDLVLRMYRLEQLSSLQKEVDKRREILVPVKHGIAAHMLTLIDAEVKAEVIPVHIHRVKTEKNSTKIRVENPQKWSTQYSSTKPQHYVSPHRNIRGRPLHRITTSVTLRLFYLV